MTKNIEKIRASRKKIGEENPRLMTLVKTIEELRFSHGHTRKQIFISLSVILVKFMEKSGLDKEEIRFTRRHLLSISKKIPDNDDPEEEEDTKKRYYALMDG